MVELFLIASTVCFTNQMGSFWKGHPEKYERTQVWGTVCVPTFRISTSPAVGDFETKYGLMPDENHIAVSKKLLEELLKKANAFDKLIDRLGFGSEPKNP